MLRKVLKEFRVLEGISQSKLSEKLGFKSDYVQKIENRPGMNSLQVLLRYSNHYKLPVSSILLYSEYLQKNPQSCLATYRQELLKRYPLPDDSAYTVNTISTEYCYSVENDEVKFVHHSQLKKGQYYFCSEELATNYMTLNRLLGKFLPSQFNTCHFTRDSKF